MTESNAPRRSLIFVINRKTSAIDELKKQELES